MDETNTIQVLVLEPKQLPTGRQAIPRPENVVQTLVDVPVAQLKEEIGKVAAHIAEAFEGIRDREGAVTLDEISVQIAVTASGKIQLVAGLGVEVGSAMTLTFRVADGSKENAS